MPKSHFLAPPPPPSSLLSPPPGVLALYDAVDGPEEEEKGQSPPRDTSGSKRTLTVAKYASVRGLTVYFCRDQESYRCYIDATRQRGLQLVALY